MLQLEHRKGLVAEYLVAILSSIAGYKIAKDNLDNGVDLSIIQLGKYTLQGKTRYMNAGKSIDIQIKCTTKRYISQTDTLIKYDLPVKNH